VIEILLKSQIISLKNLPILLIILFVVQGIIFSGMYPLWEGYDEYAHFAFIQHVAEEKILPTYQDYLSNEIVYTFEKTPMSNSLRWNAFYVNNEHLLSSYSNYWDSFDINEIQNNRKLISSQPLESRINSEPRVPIYEAQQPPLSYIVHVPVYQLFYDQDILTRVFALRIFSVFITAAAAVVAYKTISLLFDDRFIRVGSLMFIVFNPMFITNISRVNNEAVTIFLFSVFLYMMILYLKGKTNTMHVLVIGVIVGLGLLTKSTFMPAVLLVPIFIFLKHIQTDTVKPRISKLHSLKNLGLIFGVAIPMVSWLYFERFTTGNFSGIEGVQGGNLGEYIPAILEIPWYWVYDTFFRTFWGMYGTSHIYAPDTFFLIVIILMGISIACLGYGIAIRLKQQGSKIFRNWRYQSIFAVALSFPLILLGQLIFNLQYWVVDEKFLSVGWYSFISFTAIAMVLLLGYRTIIINTKLKRFKEESLLVALIILIIFNATTFYELIPNYYLGA